jgi:hypothetical protein
MTWPVEAGGGGRSALERFVVFEALIAEGAPVATSWFADRQMGPTLLQFGTPSSASAGCPGSSRATSHVVHRHVRARRRLRRGLAAHPGRARRRRLDRQRPEDLDSGAAHADWCYLIARTDPDAPTHGLSEFIVDMRSPGITITPIVDMTGNDHFCEVYFDDVRVPAENLVGELNGSFRRSCARWSTSGAASTGWCRTARSTRTCLPLADTSTTPTCARRSPPSRPATASAGCSCCARCSARPRAVLGRHQDLLHRVRAAGGRLLRRASSPARLHLADA